MIILGLILLLLGLLLKISILWTIGIIVLVVGLILLLLGSTGRAVGGRRHWFCDQGAGGGRSAFAMTADSASRAATTTSARSTPTCWPRKPSSGGPARNAQSPIEATTLTRAAARAGSSAAALIPTGKPSEVPAPHSSTPRNASHTVGANTNSASPAAATAASTRTTGTRPWRSSRPGPDQRAAVIAARKTAKPTVAVASGTPWPSMNATLTQSFAVPSAKANASTNTPTIRVRGSRQAERARPGSRAPGGVPAGWSGT